MWEGHTCVSQREKNCLEGQEEKEMIKSTQMEYTNPYFTGRWSFAFKTFLQSMSHKFIWKCFLSVWVTILYKPKQRYEAWEPKEVLKKSERKRGPLKILVFRHVT